MNNQNNIQKNMSSSDGGMKFVLIAVIGAFAIIALAVIALIIVLGINRSGNQTAQTAQSMLILETDVPDKNIQVESENINRVSMYSPDYEYKRMPEIHNSIRSDDGMLKIMNDFIQKYVTACDDYMNNNSSEIFKYLVQGTTAYEQQTGFKSKHPEITQYCLSVSVQDVREYGGYYYVWDTEELRIIKNGSSNVETSRWVYKITAAGENYHVVDYTYDPAFK